MSTHTFTTEQIALHSEVRNSILTATKKAEEGGGERTARKAYTPEHDMQLLGLLKEDGRATRFGSANTEDKKDICDEICTLLKDRYNQERTPDSLYYRISKLVKAEDLNKVNYRTAGEEGEEKEEKPKAERKPRVKKADKEASEPAGATTAKSEETTSAEAPAAPKPISPTPAPVVAKAATAAAAAKKPTTDDDFLEG